MPGTEIKTALVGMRHPEMAAAELARRLRTSDPPVIPRVQDDKVLIDVRLLLEGDEDLIERALERMG